MREWWATWLLALGACLLAVPSPGNASTASGASLQIDMLDAAADDVSIEKPMTPTLTTASAAAA